MRYRLLMLSACAITFGAVLGNVSSDAATLAPLASFGEGDGNIAPGERTYLTADNLQRGLAYNPVNNHLYVVNRAGGLSVNILDGTTGADLGTLNITGVGGTGTGLFPGNMIGVSDDGAIYMGNLTTIAGNPVNGNFRVYRWADDLAAPTLAFNGAPLPGARIGDSLDIFGSGANTLIAAGYHSSPGLAGNNSFALLSTTDGVIFTGAHIAVADVPPDPGDFRLGITFQDADTVIGRQTTDRLAQIVDISGSTGTLNSSFATEGTNYNGMDFAVVQGKPLLALVNLVNSAVAVYDITPPFDMVDPNPNIAVGNASSTTNANGNGTGQVKYGPITGNTAIVYAMNTNNGIQAYTLTLDVPQPTENADFDGDGDVDGDDLAIWGDDFGVGDGSGTPDRGDANGDGNIDGDDFLVWQRQFGTVPTGGAAAVPEPGTLALAAAIALACCSRKQRCRIQ